MYERFREHLESRQLLPKGAPILVGYSGGADSTCLLHMLAGLGYDLIAAHLHHGQRAEAELEMRLCEGFCSELEVAFVAGRADVPRIAQESGVSLEEAGRNARYEFFRQAKGRLNCAAIVTAHTRTDLVETVILNLARGTGLAGLAGIPESRDGIVRPLLPFSREETRAYCDELGLWYHDDPSNDSLEHSRARIRHHVVPELAHLNPSLEATVARSAALVGEEDQFLNGMAAAALENSEESLNGALNFITQDVELAFHTVALGHLPSVLFRRAIRLAVGALGGGLDFAQTKRIEDGLREGGKGSVTTEGGTVVMEWTPDRVHVRQIEEDEPFRFALTIPGETVAEVFGWQFTAFEDGPTLGTTARNALTVEILKANIRGPLYFRSVQPGDQITPQGFDHRRKLSDLFGEAKLTQSARRRLPIVCDLLGPIWAPGVCLDARATAVDPTKVTEDRVIRIEFGNLNS